MAISMDGPSGGAGRRTYRCSRLRIRKRRSRTRCRRWARRTRRWSDTCRWSRWCRSTTSWRTGRWRTATKLSVRSISHPSYRRSTKLKNRERATRTGPHIEMIDPRRRWRSGCGPPRAPPDSGPGSTSSTGSIRAGSAPASSSCSLFRLCFSGRLFLGKPRVVGGTFDGDAPAEENDRSASRRLLFVGGRRRGKKIDDVRVRNKINGETR